MKKYASILSFACLVALGSGCGGDSGSSGGVDVDLEDAIAEAEGRRAADPDAMGGNTCLLGYTTKYDELLTEAIVTAVTGFNTEVMEVDYSKVLKNPTYHSVAYEFENKRIGKHPAMDFELELKDVIKLGSIKEMSLTQFEQIYSVPTDEQIALGDQTIDDVVDGKIEHAEASEKIAELEKQGVDKETTKSATGMMKEAFANVSKSYTDVEGLGDAAAWNSFANTLNVLQDGVQFELYVMVSNDSEENKKQAIAVAEKVLEVCK